MHFKIFLRTYYNGMTLEKFYSLSKWAQEAILKEYEEYAEYG